MSELVKFSNQGGIGVITVDNPPVNALSPGVPEGILAAVKAAQTDDSIQALVLIGSGRTFIAGADIREFGKITSGERKDKFSLTELMLVMEDSTKPVICAIHGTAFGGGLEVAMGAHYRVAVASAQVGQPEVKLGLIPGAGGTQRLPRLVGEARAKELILLGRRIGAQQALAYGLVNQVVPRDQLRAAGDAMLAELAGCAPLSVMHAKSAIERGYGRSMDDGLALERECYEITLYSHDRDEGLAAFAEGRAPQYRGR